MATNLASGSASFRASENQIYRDRELFGSAPKYNELPIGVYGHKPRAISLMIEVWVCLLMLRVPHILAIVVCFILWHGVVREWCFILPCIRCPAHWIHLTGQWINLYHPIHATWIILHMKRVHINAHIYITYGSVSVCKIQLVSEWRSRQVSPPRRWLKPIEICSGQVLPCSRQICFRRMDLQVIASPLIIWPFIPTLVTEPRNCKRKYETW